MKCLVVVAHPLSHSACRALTQAAVRLLQAQGHEVLVEDLYSSDFAPALTAVERTSYYAASFNAEAVQPQAQRLIEAQALVLVFPTWWFGFPAILKGWFDRVWAPGIAYDHAKDLGAIQPRLLNLRNALVITTLGSPWWVDRLVMRQPVKRVLKTALLGTCAPACTLTMLSLYKAERLTKNQLDVFARRIEKVIALWK